MNIKKMNIMEIKPYWRNPRINEKTVETVAKSIKEYGYNQIIAVDKNNVIVVGHTRYKALLSLGYKEAYCAVLDHLTDKQARQYRIMDNKSAELSSWDVKNLIPELRECEFDKDLLMEFPDFETMLAESVIKTGKHASITQEDIDKKSAINFDTFASASRAEMSKYITLVCPECGEEFKVERNDVLTRPE